MKKIDGIISIVSIVVALVGILVTAASMYLTLDEHQDKGTEIKINGDVIIAQNINIK